MRTDNRAVVASEPRAIPSSGGQHTSLAMVSGSAGCFVQRIVLKGVALAEAPDTTDIYPALLVGVEAAIGAAMAEISGAPGAGMCSTGTGVDTDRCGQQRQGSDQGSHCWTPSRYSEEHRAARI